VKYYDSIFFLRMSRSFSSALNILINELGNLHFGRYIGRMKPMWPVCAMPGYC
jgi:hypothetical protein